MVIRLLKDAGMTDLLVSVVCFLVPVVCLLTGALLGLTLIEGNVKARVRAGVKKHMEGALRNVSEGPGAQEKSAAARTEPKALGMAAHARNL